MSRISKKIIEIIVIFNLFAYWAALTASVV
jgi:hypothetical protein